MRSLLASDVLIDGMEPHHKNEKRSQDELAGVFVHRNGTKGGPPWASHLSTNMPESLKYFLGA